jgi:hypothetical protein
VIQRLLNIYRVFYNYAKKGEDKKTPAMRIGLAASLPAVRQAILDHLVRHSPARCPHCSKLLRPPKQLNLPK